MRLLSLHFTGFGPLADVRLDLSRVQPGLHLVYGGNEAGKSTALRALEGLFFGFRQGSPDVLANPGLRVGAHVVGDDGVELVVSRKKGRVGTLLDPSGRPIDELELSRRLGGVGKELFSTLFGLDHETLRKGADTLIRGGGHIGESLFEVALGVAGLSDVLAELRTEAAELYAPRGRVKKLNEALKAFADASRDYKGKSVAAGAYLEQERAIEEAREEVRRCDAEHRELSTRLHRLKRTRSVLPLLARRDALLARRAELGEVPALPADATARREQAERVLAETSEQLRQARETKAGLEARLGAIAPPTGPEDEEERIVELGNRLAAHEAVAARIPTLEGELARLTQTAEVILRRLGRSGDADAAEELRIGVAERARVQKLALDAGRVTERVEVARREAGEAERRVATLLEERRSLPTAVDVRAVALARTRGERLDDLREQLARASRDVDELDRTASALAEGLGFDGSPRDAARRPMPPSDVVSAHAQGLAGLRAEVGLARERLGMTRARKLEARAALDALAEEGDVPTEHDLLVARSARDQAFEALLASRARAPGAPAVRSYERAVRDADELSDRLRREASRVAQKARHGAEAAKLDATLAEQTASLKEAERALDAGEAALARLTADTPLSRQTPEEMVGWLSRHRELARAVESLERAERAEESVRARARALGDAIAHALAAVEGEREDLDDASPLEHLEHQLARAREVMDASERAARAAERVTHDLEEAEREHARASRELETAETERRAFEQAWRDAIAPLGLGERAGPEQVTAVLAELDELFRLQEDVLRVRRELSVERAAEDRFARDVSALAEARAPELSGELPAATLARALLDRFVRDRGARTQRRALADKLAVVEAESAEAHQRRRVAEADLEALLRASGSRDAEELVRAERVHREAKDLDDRLRSLDEQLALQAEGEAPDTLRESLAEGASVDDLAVEMEEVEALLEALDGERARMNRAVGEREAGLRTLGGDTGAAEAATLAESHLAEASRLAAHYVRLKCAATILEREIERYRDENQDPLLARAGELLERLTLGRFVRVRAVTEDEDVVFQCERFDGVELSVEEMSDGTRDQLYLALRLATLERRTAAAEPMPFVLDDILVHSDDDRARAALRVLGELSERVQVLFFTHHARLRELAREAVPVGRLAEHELPAAPQGSTVLASS